MTCKDFCSCLVKDCKAHPEKHNWECAPCIEKNLKSHEIPYCFWNKIGDTENANSNYTFLEFAKNVVRVEA